MEFSLNIFYSDKVYVSLWIQNHQLNWWYLDDHDFSMNLMIYNNILNLQLYIFML